MDAVGSGRAALMLSYDAGPMGLLFAASKPDRTAALILVNTSCKYIASDDYPAGFPADEAEALLATMTAGWGSGNHVDLQVPAVPEMRGSGSGTGRRRR
jgi:hypothetical protein